MYIYVHVCMGSDLPITDGVEGASGVQHSLLSEVEEFGHV